ncbi:hypothetical protein D3C87_1963850 [compost metagenome]
MLERACDAHPADSLRSLARDIRTVDAEHATGGFVEATDQVECGAFASAVGADQTKNFVGVNFHAQV